MAHGKSLSTRPLQIVAVRNGGSTVHYVLTSEPGKTLCGEEHAWKVVRGKAAALCEECKQVRAESEAAL